MEEYHFQQIVIPLHMCIKAKKWYYLFLKLYLNTVFLLTPTNVQMNVFLNIHGICEALSQISKLYGFCYKLPTWNTKAQNSPTDDHTIRFYYH